MKWQLRPGSADACTNLDRLARSEPCPTHLAVWSRAARWNCSETGVIRMYANWPSMVTIPLGRALAHVGTQGQWHVKATALGTLARQ